MSDNKRKKASTKTNTTPKSPENKANDSTSASTSVDTILKATPTKRKIENPNERSVSTPRKQLYNNFLSPTKTFPPSSPPHLHHQLLLQLLVSNRFILCHSRKYV